MSLKDLLGGKGANLAEMTSVLELPVPHGFTITTDACRAYMDGGLAGGPVRRGGQAQLDKLETSMGKRLGDAADPLLVSVRSGAKFSMPGMMDTVLNLGLNDESVQGPGQADRRRALRLRQLPAVRPHVRPHRARHPRRGVRRALRGGQGAAGRRERRRGARPTCWPTWSTPSRPSCEHHTGQPFPQDPADQLRGAIEAVFRSWSGARAVAYRVRERIPHDLGTAVNVQAMVFGNRDDNSGTGVGFTRDPATGAAGAYGDFLVNAQGEDVVAGIRNTLPAGRDEDGCSPPIYDELLAIFERLERHYRDMCDTEFTIEQGKLWMLQTRVGKRTGAAALRMAVDMTTDEPHATSPSEEAVQRVTGDHLEQVLHPQFAETDAPVIATGLAASPGRGRRAGPTSPPTTPPRPPSGASR